MQHQGPELNIKRPLKVNKFLKHKMHIALLKLRYSLKKIVRDEWGKFLSGKSSVIPVLEDRRRAGGAFRKGLGNVGGNISSVGIVSRKGSGDKSGSNRSMDRDPAEDPHSLGKSLGAIVPGSRKQRRRFSRRVFTIG